MDKRLELHEQLLKYSANVHFQPPSNIHLTYPCIIYNKTDKARSFGNDKIYLTNQGYQLTVIDKDPDSVIADTIESDFQYCVITQYYTVDNLNHTTLLLYY